MEVGTMFSPAMAGNFLFQFRCQLCLLKNQHMLKFNGKNEISLNHMCLEKRHKVSRCSVHCSSSSGKYPTRSAIDQIKDAKVTYSVVPAMGHNQESHPECNSRVPAIVNALEKMELTSKFRGSEVIELQSWKPASVEDVASVHAKAYVSGLEKVMVEATEKGLIFIDGSGPTYATAMQGYHLLYVSFNGVWEQCGKLKTYWISNSNLG